MDKINISVFFPFYNEEENIEKSVREADRFLLTAASDYEIIIVDDGSSDATAKIAQNLARENPKVKVIHHEKNMGYGAALRTGIKNCKKEYIFFTDGDNQFDIKDLSKLLPYVRDFDIVAGFRVKRKDNFIRRLNAMSWNLLVYFLYGLKIKDVNCAFKIFRREVTENLELKSSFGFINAELLVRAKKLGFTIKHVGVTHCPRQRGKQTGARLRAIFGSLYELLKLRQELK